MSGDVTVNQVDSLLAESRALTLPATLEIDLGHVQEVDSVALSLIFEWVRQAQAAKAAISIVHVPDTLTSLATLYGVLDLIPQSSH